jgi:hypothetical protein
MSAATLSVILGASRSGDPGDPWVNGSGVGDALWPRQDGAAVSSQAEAWIPGTAQKRGPRMMVMCVATLVSHDDNITGENHPC